MQEGLSRHELAARFGVAPSTVINWVRRFRKTGSVAPGLDGRTQAARSIRDRHAAFLVERIRDGALQTLRGLWPAELAERGVAQGRLSLGVEFRPRGEARVSKKKRRGERARTAPRRAKTGAMGRSGRTRSSPGVWSSSMRPGRKPIWTAAAGWGAAGAKGLVASVPHGHWKTMTFVAAALRCDRIEAPRLPRWPNQWRGVQNLCREGALAPTLKPGDLVIMDNLGSHKGSAIRQTIRAAALLLPAQHIPPTCNPIEQVFAKLKHLLRKTAARTIETLTAAVGELLGAYTAEECANYFTNAGTPT